MKTWWIYIKKSRDTIMIRALLSPIDKQWMFAGHILARSKQEAMEKMLIKLNF